jgi:predicted small metal-binding protein
MAAESNDYKELSCRDFRADCDYTARAGDEENVIKLCEEHACKTHGKCGMSPQIREKMKSHIRDVRL